MVALSDTSSVMEEMYGCMMRITTSVHVKQAPSVRDARVALPWSKCGLDVFLPSVSSPIHFSDSL